MAKQASTLTITGKLGNVVGFSRTASKRSGTKFARLHNANVKNPRTQAQLVQRAIAATITKAYSAMSQICNHSFEGKAVGVASMQYFNKINMDLLRARIVADFNGENSQTPANQVGVVVAPNSTFCTPGPYKISEGQLKNNFLNLVYENGFLNAKLTPASSGESLKDYLSRCGIVKGDIFTIVGLGVIAGNGAFASQYGVFASQPSTSFGFIRFKVKDSAFEINTDANDQLITSLFDIEAGGTANTSSPSQLDIDEFFCGIDAVTGCNSGFMGVIRSRDNQMLRSTCILQTINGGDVSEVSNNGIKSGYLLNAWTREVDTIGQSTLILEGGNI